MELTEKDIENYIVSHPSCISNYGNTRPITILGQQICVKHGIIDILGWQDRVLVIEVKLGKLKEKDVGQVLRYVNDIHNTLQIVGIKCKPSNFNDLAHSWLWERTTGTLLFNNQRELPIVPVLVGADIDPKTLASARGANCHVYLWEQQDDEIVIWDGCSGISNNSLVPLTHIPNWLSNLTDIMASKCELDHAQLIEEPSPEFIAYSTWLKESMDVFGPAAENPHRKKLT